ncbi:unnamed protein product [Phaedon cochleariae]|uniref:Double jelly roll-like domain-containing protein n=1 Tax=Phaedon cochleariae TaxID=80249 RepID=A0A9N9SJA4_PHACE|nr:unnamed protein product [Phaedon cochleariae]
MSGCDATSAPYNQGKLKFVKTITKNPNIADVVSVLKNSEATPESIAAAGERFLVNVYGCTGRTEPSINRLRNINYKKAAFKTSSKKAALPPSAAAATQQSFRVYLQVVERANTALQGSPQTQSIAKITIESINLKVPHLTPNDDIKLQLLTRIKADESMMIPFRRWELHELPALTQGSTIEIWSVKTCSALDSPRYVIVFFQTKKADNLHEDVTLFDNANIKSIRLALNSDYYPQERMLLDFSKDQYADAHFNYTEFNKSYHNSQEKRSLVNFAEFKSRPMFVIDCSRRHLGLKSSTVDIKHKGMNAYIRGNKLVINKDIYSLEELDTEDYHNIVEAERASSAPPTPIAAKSLERNQNETENPQIPEFHKFLKDEKQQEEQLQIDMPEETSEQETVSHPYRLGME